MKQAAGSSKALARIFGGQGKMTKKSLAAAVEDARSSQFKIVRWWWRGQPAIDRVSAVMQVAPSQVGSTVQQLAGLQGGGTSVSIEVFPYGIPKLDQVLVQIQANLNGK